MLPSLNNPAIMILEQHVGDNMHWLLFSSSNNIQL
jgi:hypothetical protein